VDALLYEHRLAQALFENGFEQMHTVSVSGGADKFHLLRLGSYADQNGVIRYANDNNKRYQLRLNYDYDFSRRIRLKRALA